MAKIALLIGISEYESDLTPLPAATKDVEAMQQVLENPEIGGFDEVKVLVNPQQQDMAVAIETLFNSRQKDDLLLLFFSGHGIKDEEGNLYFATRNTRKNLLQSTTVSAKVVHQVMKNSRSKREVVILDCCFSGAFANDMLARDDGFVDIKNQLGGEGRAVLTSSTSTQYSFEQQGADTSTYTRYIVEGLETGAADRDEDGWISVDELHEYATKAVQEATPAMKPEIYAIKEGYKINLAKAPIDDPKLRYHREVDYWVDSGNGEISFIGRTALDALRDKLKLTSEDTTEIEAKVLAPIEVHKKNLQGYEQAFRNKIQLGFPLSDRNRADLKRLQQVSGLRDEDVALIEAPIIAEQSLSKTPVVVNHSHLPNSNFKYFIGACTIGVIGVVIGGTLVYFIGSKPVARTSENSCAKETYSSNDRISLGEKILLKQDTNPDKEAGVKAFLEGDCKTAIDKFERYRTAKPTDPEALIYLNNAKARQQINRLKIAVSGPIGSNANVAKEMLRGVAQAQDEVNNNGGINGKVLEVAIANDNNNSSEAGNIATQFVKDSRILAVVGHNSSNASLAAAPIYQQGGLVMISPTSNSPNLSNIGKYIFRTTAGIRLIVDSVSRYAIQKAGKNNFVICLDDKAIDNLALKDEFRNSINAANGKINPTICDISAPNFNPSVIISQAINTGANALVLGLYIDKIKEGLAVARTNQGRLSIFSASTLFTDETLENGKAVNSMVIAVPWHNKAFLDHPFLKKSNDLWKAPVNWRTATSYDATLAIIEGLKVSNTRYELQNKLHDSGFSVDGATGKIQFSKSGDRINNKIFLIQVQLNPTTKKYEFVPIQP